MKKKVVYSVAGEGFGHAVKALAVKELLKDEIDFTFLGGDKAYEFLSDAGEKVIRIPCLRLIYTNDAVDMVKTTAHSLKMIFRRNKILKEITSHLTAIEPDYVMSDFEYFVPRVARRLNIPTIQLSHQMLLLAGKYRLPLSALMNYISTYCATRLIIPRSTYHVGVSFFHPPVWKKYQTPNFRLSAPLLRKEILDADCKPGQKIVVYSSCATFAWILDVLARFTDESFIVYGLSLRDKTVDYPNIEVKKISPTTFIEDLAHAKAVISNGGHTLITEALYLKKPVFSFYVNKQFEQFLNAWHIEKLGYGRRRHPSRDLHDELTEFIKEIPIYTQNLTKQTFCGNAGLRAFLREKINPVNAQTSEDVFLSSLNMCSIVTDENLVL